MSRSKIYAAALPNELDRFVKSLSQPDRDEFDWHFGHSAHDGQLPPDGDWRIWLIMAGRGFGKTRAGAEWVRSVAEADEHARIALVGASLGEVRAVMVEGESGLMSVGPPERRPVFEPSLRRLRWPHGPEAVLYSAAEPESLRGPQHSHAWCDELAKWPSTHGRAEAAWSNLQLGLRLGQRQQVIVTTTPRSVPLLRKLLASEGIAITRGRTEDNARNLPAAFIDAMRGELGNSALGRQELDGELLEDIEGALWSRSLLERCRADRLPEGRLTRVVVGVDPPASARGDACGIVVAAREDDGGAVVLADCSLEKPTPERWARAVAETARAWSADRVVAEANQGGAMVASVLRAADVSLPVKLVHASRGKAARAEPVAALYEAGRVRHAGTFAQLEDEMCGLMAGGGYEGSGRSPDRADALVWALTELMLGKAGRPRVRGF
ncbi:terminase family protein [Alteriqipengyuania flavescens]|uniref:DNA-packaging protein n=1 Tax=Alteriqipengyuania flavescens TaxID=3053610 RepID=UPI0025B3718C|nr:terminase family protein [Alteriqipengyuania flavescens]WJY19442.1 terminase family protein [Alteriqipengyuania flavescens]WJY25384.1 terminase family protein [Alteriqipengyuania flavescens]